ncbi:MAG: type II/IV secretion system ATPase subunit [Nanoarchaeales archaeon]|nr:type II/IV secretion system ATPase subunit [Nanoarchaeales archaeon]
MEILDKYDINFESSTIPITIYKDRTKDMNIIYEVGILEIGKYTNLIVEKIKEDLLREGIFDSNSTDFSYDKMKKSFISKVEELIKFYFPNLRFEERENLITYLVQKSLDLGFVDILISDPQIEEITINGSEAKVMIYHRTHGWLKTNLQFLSDDEIKNIALRIALENKKFFSNLTPLLDAHLRGGHRVNATLDAVSTKGTTMTIRRFSDKPWTVSDLITSGTSTPTGLALIWIAMENEMSIIIAGGTGSGKTSFLNSITSFIPMNQRIISVEDTREIRLPDYSHWVPMEARQANQEGKGQVSMLDLIVNSLRMRPDRILIGEIRKKEEAEVLFEAMRTGHSVYGTFHANTTSETILRLTNAPINIPKISLNALGLICIQHRDRKSGKRMTLQIAEINEDGSDSVVLQYNPKTKETNWKNKPVNLIKKLDEFNGINEKEFYQLLKEREYVLSYMARFKINDIDSVGQVIDKYYNEKEKLFKIIHRKNTQYEIEQKKNQVKHKPNQIGA